MSIQTVEEEVTKTIKYDVIICDICKQKIPPSQIDVSNYSEQNRRSPFEAWWEHPLNAVVNIIKGSIYNHETASVDFNVHVKCAYDAIRRRIKEVKS